ncbi:MAG: hypothetical protein ACE5E7_04185 [Anaerolineae bacterium]
METTLIAMMTLRALVFALGLATIVWTLVSAVKTFILPRGVSVWLTRIVFRGIGAFFRLRARRAGSYEERDRIMVLFAPMALILMPIAVLSMVLLGYLLLYWALDTRPFYEAFKLSGSSLFTLGYASQDSLPFKLLEFSEAMLGLLLVALLIAYLPAIYTAFARRETAVALLEARAGAPPSAFIMITRSHRTRELGELREFWMGWQTWFAELEESHTSLAILAFFRSPQPGRSWVTAAGTVLDSAALMLAAVDVPFEPRAAFCIRTGYLALRHIARFFDIPHNPDPAPDDPISVSRVEFDQGCDRLAAEGVPMKRDRDQAWRDFAGWRVNYDTVLLALAALTMAPFAPWSSDRSRVLER